MIEEQSEGMVLVCECGGTRLGVVRRTRTAVELECAACGRKLSVKGGLAPASVSTGEVEYAKQSCTVVYPDPDAETARPTDPEEPDRPRRRSLRFKLDDAQHAAVHRAIMAARILNWDMDVMRGQQWHGTALECILADFLAGVPREALAIVDRIEGAVAAAVAQYEAERGQPASERQRRGVRRGVYDDLCAAFQRAQAGEDPADGGTP